MPHTMVLFAFCGALAILLPFTSGSDDRGYCGRRERTHELYSDSDIHLVPINIRGRGQKNDVLVVDATNTPAQLKLYKLNEPAQLLGGTEITISDPNYCGDGAGDSIVITSPRLHVADVNGDGTDDLVCRDLTGTFTVRYFAGNDFSPARDIAHGFSCNLPAITLTGDIDGNGADDFVCVSDDRLQYQFYFNKLKRVKYSLNAFQEGINGQKHHPLNRMPEGREPHLPVLFSWTAPSADLCPNADGWKSIRLTDVNGDKYKDLVCLEDDDIVYHILSSGVVSSSIFSSTIVQNSQANCDYSSSAFLATDVDGDGDGDLICLDVASGSNRIFPVSHFSNGNLGAFVEYPATSNNCYSFCRSQKNVRQLFGVADINGDGFEDLFCRATVNTNEATEILFSQSLPTIDI